MARAHMNKKMKKRSRLNSRVSARDVRKHITNPILRMAWLQDLQSSKSSPANAGTAAFQIAAAL